MQKSLKKSLYLGLAALSFASVAGATNANAAKKHHSKKTVKTVKKAKPVTYTSSYNLDQSVVYSLNGNNAIYTKPGTVKGARVVASKSDVKSVANSSRGYFMAYGEAKTSKGVHYYKVVSFDHKYRGWVYAGSAKKVDSTTTATDTPKNNVVYLKNNVSNTLWDAPKYSAFKTTKAANNNAAIANDQYKVDKAVKLNREGWTYYHVTNQANPNYTGWVWAGATADAKPTDNFNAAKDIKVNFVYNGSTVKSSVFHAYDMGLRTNNSNVFDQNDLNAKLFTQTTLQSYNNDNRTNWLNAQLAGSGYAVTDNKDAKGFDTNTHNYAALNGVKFGDTVYLSVVKSDVSTGKLNAYALGNNQYVSSATPLTSDNVTFPVADNDSLKKVNKAYYDYFGQAGSAYQKTNFDTFASVLNDNPLISKSAITFNDLGATKSVYNNVPDAKSAFSLALSKAQAPSNEFNANTDETKMNVRDIKDVQLVSSSDANQNATTFAKNVLKMGDSASVVGNKYTVTDSSQYGLKGNEIYKAVLVGNGSTTSGSDLTKSRWVILDDNSKVVAYSTVNLPKESSNYSMNDFAGLRGGSQPYGMFDTNSDSNFMKPAVGNNSEQYHIVYFLDAQRTKEEMGNKKMNDGVKFYYYAVPVAGSVSTTSTLDYLAK
ncbi:hypothetical protein [Apilactobacillus xinyiensis]|uniref:hypothetical protein n=1 Tax=Apilactobacillus xinyiensis TaxID=2841032 RepID=UPI0020100593|nr:hypothetical protein [Apilactobacillus xinyiensis]MCL0318921.1 hypothetical protein [Apilactobacillus xinyiensis]